MDVNSGVSEWHGCYSDERKKSNCIQYSEESRRERNTRIHIGFCFEVHGVCFAILKRVFPIPIALQRSGGIFKRLIENIAILRARVLIPVFEETFLIAKFKNELLPYVNMVVPDYSQILTVHNKDRWTEIARSLNIPVPQTCSLEGVEGSKKEITGIRYPVLVKPKQGGGAWGIRQVSSREELERLIGEGTYLDRPLRRFFLQEKIVGENHCVAMLFRHGELRAKVAYRQIRDYPIEGGQATLRVSLRNDEAENHLQRLLEELRWHGVCEADFVVENQTRIPYLIDINPRFWGSLAQAIASGVDFPYLVYKIASEGDVEPVKDFKTGVMTRWIGGDLRTFMPLLRRSKNKIEFLHQFMFPGNGKIFYDDFSLKDPLPFLTWVLDGLFRMIRSKSINPGPHDSLEGIWE